MDSRLHGLPLTATMAAFSKNTISGIRAPLTIDESDFEYSFLSKSRRNSRASSCYSNSELDEPEGIESGQDEEINEKTHPFHEHEFYERSLVKPNGLTVQKESFSNENGFSRPFVRNPGEKSSQESSQVDKKPVFRAFVGNPDERIYRVLSNVNDCDDSASLLSESGDEFVEDDYYDLNNSISKPISVIADDENLVDGPTQGVDSKFSVEQKLHIPIAKLSRDSDDDSQGSEVSDEGFSDVIRIPRFDVLSRHNSALKVRMSENDDVDEYDWEAENMVEMEFVKDSLIINDVLGPEDENEHTDVEDIKNCVTSCEMVQDGGPDVNEEDKANSLVNEDERYNPIPDSEGKSDLVHLEGNIQEIFVADDGKKCSLEESTFSNQYVESKNLETERELEIELTVDFFRAIGTCINGSPNQCVDVIKNVHEFGSPEPHAENLQVSISDSHLGDDTSSIGSVDSQSVLELTKLDQETEKEAEIALESLTLLTEMEGDIDTISRKEIFLDDSQEVDCQMSTVSDNSAVMKPQSVDGTDNFSPESTSCDLGSMLVSSRPNIEARNSDLLVVPSTYSEQDGTFSEGERKKKVERIQQIRAKYMQVVHGLGHSPEDSLASKVLRQLSIAEEKYSPREFFSNAAIDEAVELGAQEKGYLDFSLHILVIGKTGVGKSATVNSIIGQSTMMVNAFEPSTSRVMEINGEINGVKLKIFDTPGLRISPIDQSVNRKILLSIKKIMRKAPPDVILYVDRLDTQFNYLNDLPLLKSVTLCLGPSIWQKSVLVFTHADLLLPDGPDGCPLSYEKFVADQSRAVQQLISQSAVEMNGDWIIPASLVENLPFSENNVNVETWRKRLLYLCCSMKVLSDVSSAVKIHNTLDRVKMLFGYGFLQPSCQILTRPVLELYDDCVYDNDALIEHNLDNECCSPAVLSVQHPKNKHKFNIQLRSLVWNKESAQTRLDSQTFGQIKKFSHTGKVRSDRKLSGKIYVKTGCSDQLQIVGLVIFPIAKALFDKISRQPVQD